MQGTPALYEQFLNGTRTAKAPELYYRYLMALSNFSDPALLQRTLDYAISPAVRSQDTTQLVAAVMVNPGAVTQAVFEVVNTTDHAVTGQAIPSYGPQYAAQYFRKLDCFCFAQQTLQPGETRRMPVVFVIDPAAPKELRTITLSYTFFEVEGNRKG
jgi:hypothetical protein